MEVDHQEEGWRLTAKMRGGGGPPGGRVKVDRQEEGWRLTARRRDGD